MNETTANKDNPLLRYEWEIATLADHCGLYCVLTRSMLMIRRYDDHLGSVDYEHLNELFDAPRMCDEIERDTGLIITRFQWGDFAVQVA